MHSLNAVVLVLLINSFSVVADELLPQAKSIQATSESRDNKGIEVSESVVVSQSESIKNWKNSAKRGDKEAQYNLGLLYEQGLGIKLDLEKALYWYKMSAKQNHVIAAYNYASMLHHGNGIAKNITQAAIWYERSANLGNVIAQASLGYLLSLQSTSLTNVEKAVYWLERAAKLGYPEAQFNLAMMYSTGRGAELSYINAYAWFDVSAANQYTNGEKSRNFAAARLTKSQLIEAKSLSKHFHELYFKKHFSQ